MNRLSRLDTVFTEAPVYFITACTEKRRHLLANDDAHEVFRRFCMLARERGVLVGRYVLMPDHLHLFVCIPPGAVGLSMWMKSLKNTMSKHWRERGIEAPHWQKGFFDHLIRSPESHAEKWNMSGRIQCVRGWSEKRRIGPMPEPSSRIRGCE